MFVFLNRNVDSEKIFYYIDNGRCITGVNEIMKSMNSGILKRSVWK